LIFSLPLFGQNKPLWLDANSRNAQFPKDVFITGFAEGNTNAGENTQKAIERTTTAAQSALLENLRVVVSSTTSSKTVSISQNENYDEYSTFLSSSEKSANAEIIGMNVETYYDKSNNTVYAFSYVSKADLFNYYKKQIILDLNKIETALGVSEQLAAAGKKISAFRKCDEVKNLFKSIEFYQDLLVAVNSQADDDALQTERSKDLAHTISQRLINLEQSTFVYVDCKYEYKGGKDDAFDSDPNIICDIVKQAFSENDCSIVEDDAEADYTLTLTAYTTQRSDGTGKLSIISYYANVKGTLYNKITNKKTVDFSIFNDPNTYAAGKSPEDAATKAFKLPALKQKILEKVLSKMKN
jgi:hypothetical protein